MIQLYLTVFFLQNIYTELHHTIFYFFMCNTGIKEKIAVLEKVQNHA